MMKMVKKGRKPVISYKEMFELVSSFKTRRDRALVSILYWSGRRVGEVVALKRDDVKYYTADIIWISFKLTKTKDNKRINTPLPLDNKISGYFLEHLDWFDKKGHKGKLFPITTDRVGQIVKEIESTISPHWFRHCRATHLGKVMSVWELSSYFGWKDINTALTYTHTAPDFILKKMMEVENHDKET